MEIYSLAAAVAAVAAVDPAVVVVVVDDGPMAETDASEHQQKQKTKGTSHFERIKRKLESSRKDGNSRTSENTHGKVKISMNRVPASGC